MRIKVHLQEYGTESPEPHTILLNCGAGEQILRWVAYAACGRMAFQKGDVPSAYVPQSVLQADGTILDVDIVLNEMLGDGDELYVEYSHGPTVFKCRWEGRPRTPPHVWGETAVTENVEYDWLSDLDLKAYGLNELINPDLASANAHAVDQDLDATKDIMSQYAGPLQALFIYYGTQGDSPSQEKLSLSQFRDIILDSQIASEKFVPGMIDEAFNKARYAQASVQESGKRRQSAGSKLGLQEFIFALIFVAAKKLDLGFEGSGWGFAALSERFYKLLTEFIFPNLIPAIAERIRAISQPYADENVKLAVEALQKKGRRLTEQALDSCQLKRVQMAEPVLDLKYLCQHLIQWEYLDKHFDMCTFSILCLHAKHNGSADVQAYPLHKHPLQVSYNDFERLLLAIASHMYQSQVQTQASVPFEQFFGELLDDAYKRSGVLVDFRRTEVKDAAE